MENLVPQPRQRSATRRSLEKGGKATLTPVLLPGAGAPGGTGESVVQARTEGEENEPVQTQHRRMEAFTVKETGQNLKFAVSKHDFVGTMTGNTETTLLEAGVLTTTADIPIKHPGTREVVITARQQTAIAPIWMPILCVGINVSPVYKVSWRRTDFC